MNATAMATAGVDPRLATSLAALVPRIAACFIDPWWVIGSTAAHLAITHEIALHDIDVLASVRDVEAFAGRHADALDCSYVPGDDGRFRSRFARFRFGSLPVELMGGLQVDDGSGWREVDVAATCIVDCSGQPVPVPTPAEQVRLFELFGRAKDLDKARLLRRLATESVDAA